MWTLPQPALCLVAVEDEDTRKDKKRSRRSRSRDRKRSRSRDRKRSRRSRSRDRGRRSREFRIKEEAEANLEPPFGDSSGGGYNNYDASNGAGGYAGAEGDGNYMGEDFGQVRVKQEPQDDGYPAYTANLQQDQQDEGEQWASVADGTETVKGEGHGNEWGGGEQDWSH